MLAAYTAQRGPAGPGEHGRPAQHQGDDQERNKGQQQVTDRATAEQTGDQPEHAEAQQGDRGIVVQKSGHASRCASSVSRPPLLQAVADLVQRDTYALVLRQVPDPGSADARPSGWPGPVG